MSRTAVARSRYTRSTIKEELLIEKINEYDSKDQDDDDSVQITDDDSDDSGTLVTKSISHINSSTESFKKKETVKKCTQNCYVHYLRIGIFIIVVIFVSLSVSSKMSDNKPQRPSIEEWEFPTEDNVVSNKETQEELIARAEKLIAKVHKKFSNQKSNIWNDITAGIQEVVWYPNKPVIFTLFGNDTGTMYCFAKALGQISGTVLGTNDHLILTPRDFANDVGEVIHYLKPQIMEKKAIIIEDLLNINYQAIKAFHNFCDKENPLVCHAIYIITVVVNKYNPSQNGLEIVEKEISNKLADKIDKDILDALVTRITSGAVIPVLPEAAISNCLD